MPKAFWDKHQQFVDEQGYVGTINKSSDSNGNAGVFIADGAINDAFARLRTSDPQTLFDSKQIFDNQPLFWDDQETSGTGTSSTHSANNARSRMAVTATTAGTRVRQTFQRFNYQPGKSQLILCTGVIGAGASGITQRIGYFDANNGLLFNCEDGTMKVTRRTNVTGTPADNDVAQSSWNIDKMDGTGVSGITLDFDKTQIFIIDFEWLGTGRVRMGFVVDGKIYYCHEFLNANSLDVVYMSTPNLPMRYEISNDGTGGAYNLDHICSTVISEGGVQENGVLRHADTGSIASLATGSVYALLGIRLKSAYIGEVINIVNLSLLTTTQNDQFHWELFFNPTVAGTFTYSGQTNSGVEIATGSVNNTITGGTPIDGGYVTDSLPSTVSVPNALRLGSKIDGTVDEIILTAKPITQTMTIEASLTWRELS